MRKKKIRIVEWKNAICILRFKTSQPKGDHVDFRYLCRFREPITRSKRTIRGKISDEQHDSMQHGESWNEAKGLTVLIATAHPDILQVQPFQLEYELDGEVRHYTPDFLIAWGDEIWVVDVKEDKAADRKDEKTRFAEIERALATHGMHFFIWKKLAICDEPRLQNALHIMRYQRCPVPVFDRERFRRQFADQPQIILGSLSDEDIRLVLYLVIDGTLHVDWWRPLSRGSLISTTPIGRQEWPNSRTVPSTPRDTKVA